MSGAELSAAYQSLVGLPRPGPYDAPLKRILMLL